MDIAKLLEQTKEMQAKMQQMQKEFAAREFEGKAGGDLVVVTMCGDGRMKKIFIDPKLYLTDSDQKMIPDLIIRAHEAAKNKAENESKDNISNSFGNLPINF